MKKRIPVTKLLPVYAFVLIGCLCTAYFGSHVITTMVETAPVEGRICFVIDAGHGGIDGGATSCTGVLESQFNLEIALRLNDLLRFIGYETYMIRTTDTSIYTEGKTIAAQKVSDLKERVRLVNERDNAVLISIHQNTYPDGRYSGAQVFYGKDETSRSIASQIQTAFVHQLNPGSNRKSKPSHGIYLMQSINRPGVLIECGFISNIEEESQLRTIEYQQKIVCVICSEVSKYFA
ncbi:MAG: N-acetylmuramoyl-L-alanine amidase [Oscillospiraceae bacterium]|nr:N-acetylmuramoyl-L-alanine amidase [Oscillospiraceae bacterium]